MKVQTILELVAAAAVALTLAGCGGGDGAIAAAPADAAVASNTTPLKPTSAASSVVQEIDYYGDSTVWGFASGTSGTRVAQPAPSIFASLLPAAARYTVRNEGVSRTTACQLLGGTDGTHPDWPTQMRNSTAKFVIINHAINDQRADIGESVSAYKTCLTSLAQIAKQQGKNVIFETPNPTDQTGAGLDQYVTGMKEVAAAERLNLIDQYQYLLTYLNGQAIRTLMPDGIHPDDDTYVLKGRFAAAEFLKMSY